MGGHGWRGIPSPSPLLGVGLYPVPRTRSILVNVSSYRRSMKKGGKYGWYSVSLNLVTKLKNHPGGFFFRQRKKGKKIQQDFFR